MLTPEQSALAEHAFRTLDRKGNGVVPLEDICRVYDVSKHPRVKEGVMAPSAAREMLIYQFNNCVKELGGVTLDVFMRFHERMAMEAEEERTADKEKFLTEVIAGVWRIGELLQPTCIRPVIPIEGFPTGIYSTQHMSLVWPDPDAVSDGYVLRVIRDVVLPIFSRGDLPPQLRGFFAYPSELAGMRLIEVPTQIALKRWLDFAWEYAEGKYAAVEGIISARVDLDSVPPYLRDLIIEHTAAVRLPAVRFLPTTKAINPMYKCSSQEYGYGVEEEVKHVQKWKERTFDGTAYGLIYHGHVGKFTKKHYGRAQSNAASGINL
ncbi:uncharacterized protein TM35_001131060 [Trypanosoma theileri]|uniref:EF-hand domain-containing protein n=1 Tax=Trypanosoma theileri TaxID=67003 RepID=A0A1X0NFQ9_9TRYP|nr:uncharacterized protein TM35_001131060 [Trypanosoma theileri]ORC81580.1 hypothetical protein TM35_001131060 [Trypanosoma theileri]